MRVDGISPSMSRLEVSENFCLGVSLLQSN